MELNLTSQNCLSTQDADYFVADEAASFLEWVGMERIHGPINLASWNPPRIGEVISWIAQQLRRDVVVERAEVGKMGLLDHPCGLGTGPAASSIERPQRLGAKPPTRLSPRVQAVRHDGVAAGNDQGAQYAMDGPGRYLFNVSGAPDL